MGDMGVIQFCLGRDREDQGGLCGGGDIYSKSWRLNKSYPGKPSEKVMKSLYTVGTSAKVLR